MDILVVAVEEMGFDFVAGVDFVADFGRTDCFVDSVVRRDSGCRSVLDHRVLDHGLDRRVLHDVRPDHQENVGSLGSVGIGYFGSVACLRSSVEAVKSVVAW